MADYTSRPRVGWVHPKQAPGSNAKEALLNESGAGNVTQTPPDLKEVSNPRPTVAGTEYTAPSDDKAMADGDTAGNYTGITPPVAPYGIPAGGRPSEDVEI